MIIWTPTVLSVLFACFTWKDALEIRSLLLLLLLLITVKAWNYSAHSLFAVETDKIFSEEKKSLVSLFRSGKKKFWEEMPVDPSRFRWICFGQFPWLSVVYTCIWNLLFFFLSHSVVYIFPFCFMSNTQHFKPLFCPILVSALRKDLSVPLVLTPFLSSGKWVVTSVTLAWLSGPTRNAMPCWRASTASWTRNCRRWWSSALRWRFSWSTCDLSPASLCPVCRAIPAPSFCWSPA